MRLYGNQKHYQANPNSPIFDELCGITEKTMGLAEPLRAALAPLGSRIQAAFIHGSVAKRQDTASSDVDLMLVSDDLGYPELFMLLEELCQRVAVAVQCAQSLLAGGTDTVDDEGAIPLIQPATAGRRGPMPVFVQGRSEHEEAELVAERIEAACQGGRSPSEVAVLCRAKYQMRPIEQALLRRHIACQSMGSQRVGAFAWREQSVKLLTLHSAKGLEFPLVFIAGLQAMSMKDESPEEAARLLYVGMTRATHELVLSAHGDSPFVQRVGASLREVAGQFVRSE